MTKVIYLPYKLVSLLRLTLTYYTNFIYRKSTEWWTHNNSSKSKFITKRTICISLKGLNFKREYGITYIKAIPQGFLCYLSFTGQQYSEMFRSMKNFILVFLKCSEAWKTSFLPFCSVQKREKLHFGVSETFRSVKNFFFAFLKCSEACKTSFWCFWNVQKHEKLHFGLSEMFRSVKNFILVFLKCSEAWKTSFWLFWNVQKHEKSLFGLSEMFRSMKNFFLAFLQCAEAWKTLFWPFWNVQKHVLFLFLSFCVTLKHLKSLFHLSAPRLST